MQSRQKGKLQRNTIRLRLIHIVLLVGTFCFVVGANDDELT